MISLNRIRCATVMTLVAAAVSTTAQAKSELQSSWVDREITIDGAVNEWHDSLTYIDGPDVFVGALNDDRFLYLCIHSRDSEFVRRAMEQGLIIKLDAKGSDAIRIQFPMGALASGVRPPARGEAFDRDAARQKTKQSLDTFLILGPDSDDRQRVPVDNQLGIQLIADSRGGEFVYELKIPLVQNEAQPFAVNAEPGVRLSLALDTPEIDRDEMRPPMNGGRGGGMGGGKGGGRGGRGGQSGQLPETSEPMKVRAKILLATNPPDGP